MVIKTAIIIDNNIINHIFTEINNFTKQNNINIKTNFFAREKYKKIITEILDYYIAEVDLYVIKEDNKLFYNDIVFYKKESLFEYLAKLYIESI